MAGSNTGIIREVVGRKQEQMGLLVAFDKWVPVDIHSIYDWDICTISYYGPIVCDQYTESKEMAS